jgi:hypothetical protein
MRRRVIMLEGLSPDAEIVTNEKGAMQSATPYRFDLIDAKAMFKLAEVLAYGAKRYAPDNWRGISASDHYNHLMQHLNAWKAGDTQDDHLGHALCRAMMLCAVVEAEEEAQLKRASFIEALDEYAGKGVRKSDAPLEDLLP